MDPSTLLDYGPKDPFQSPSEQQTAGSQTATAQPVYDPDNLAYNILSASTDSWQQDRAAFTELQSVFKEAVEAMKQEDDPRSHNAAVLLARYEDQLAIYDDRNSTLLEDSSLCKMGWKAACDDGNELASLIFGVADSNTTRDSTYGSPSSERPQTEMSGSYVDSRRRTVAQGEQDIGPPVLFGLAISDPRPPERISRTLLNKIQELDNRKEAHYELDWAPHGIEKVIKSINVRTAEVGKFTTRSQMTFLFCVVFGADAYGLICESHIQRDLAKGVNRHKSAVKSSKCINNMAHHLQFSRGYWCICDNPKHIGFPDKPPEQTRPWENWQIEMVLESLLELEELLLPGIELGIQNVVTLGDLDNLGIHTALEVDEILPGLDCVARVVVALTDNFVKMTH